MAVVVPNEVLAATQQDLYSPWASRAHADLFEKEAITIHYCTYDDFLTARIPLSTVCLVDEVDSLFFRDAPKLTGDAFISAILLLNKYHVIGMSATFRGEQGIKWLSCFLRCSRIVHMATVVQERNINIDVFGRLNPQQIKEKVIPLAKEK